MWAIDWYLALLYARQCTTHCTVYKVHTAIPSSIGKFYSNLPLLDRWLRSNFSFVNLLFFVRTQVTSVSFVIELWNLYRIFGSEALPRWSLYYWLVSGQVNETYLRAVRWPRVSIIATNFAIIILLSFTVCPLVVSLTQRFFPCRLRGSLGRSISLTAS